jgi:hypothetical protein
VGKHCNKDVNPLWTLIEVQCIALIEVVCSHTKCYYQRKDVYLMMNITKSFDMTAVASEMTSLPSEGPVAIKKIEVNLVFYVCILYYLGEKSS